MKELNIRIAVKGSVDGETLIGVVVIDDKEVGPILPIMLAKAVKLWLEQTAEFLPSVLGISEDVSEKPTESESLYLDIQGPDGKSFRVDTPSPILGINDDSEMFVLFGGNHVDMPEHWKKIYNPFGPPNRGQRLLIASHAMDLWNIFNRKQLVGTVKKTGE